MTRVFSCPNAELGAGDVVPGQRWSRIVDGGRVQVGTIVHKTLTTGDCFLGDEIGEVSVGSLLAYWVPA